MKDIVQMERPLQPLVLGVVSLDRPERCSRERREVISSDYMWLSLVRREGIKRRHCAVVRWMDEDAWQKLSLFLTEEGLSFLLYLC